MSESKALTVQMSLQDTLTLGAVLAKSKRFEDATNSEQAVVKVMAGQELGFGPIASMCGIYVIKGRVTISANMMAQAVKRSTRYDYRVIEMTADVCEIAYYETGNEIGRSRFTKEDAAKAGTQNMGKFPRNMLFARAMSNGVKWYVPDVFQTGVYTPEELGVAVDGDGEILDVQAVTITEPPPPATEDTQSNGTHWLYKVDGQGKEMRVRFWAWTNTLALSHDQVHEALNVESVKDYTGTMGQAKEAIEAWVAAEPMPIPAGAE